MYRRSKSSLHGVNTESLYSGSNDDIRIKPQKQYVFGKDLKLISKATGDIVPYVVRVMVAEIERIKKETSIKDIYTAQGIPNENEVPWIRALLNKAYKEQRRVNLSHLKNGYCMGRVILQFFKELPNSVIPGDLYEDLIQIATDLQYSDDVQSAISDITELFAQKLPVIPNCRTLNVILRHLANMVNEESSMRDIANTWAAVLIKNDKLKNGSSQNDWDNTLLTRIVELLIEHRKTILWRGATEINRDNPFAGHLSSRTYVGNHDEQHYFCVPFSTQKIKHRHRKLTKGWLLLHFDGKHVMRQIELWPGKRPCLYIVGRHDSQLCSLTLEESELTKKRNAEIASWDFNCMWRKYGGDKLYFTNN